MDSIYRKGRDPITQEFSVPQHLNSNIDVVTDQLNLLEKMNSKETKKPPPYFRTAVLDTEVKDNDRPTTSMKPKTTYTNVKDVKDVRDSKDSSKVKPYEVTRRREDYISVVAPIGQMANKLKLAAPYNIFYTAIASCARTHSQPLTITFQGNNFAIIESFTSYFISIN